MNTLAYRIFFNKVYLTFLSIFDMFRVDKHHTVYRFTPVDVVVEVSLADVHCHLQKRFFDCIIIIIIHTIVIEMRGSLFS